MKRDFDQELPVRLIFMMDHSVQRFVIKLFSLGLWTAKNIGRIEENHCHFRNYLCCNEKLVYKVEK